MPLRVICDVIPALVINLASRRDRWKRVSRRLAAAGIPFERVNATGEPDPVRGCARSHLRALRRCEGSNWRLIFEDDVLVRADFAHWVDLLPRQLANVEWDICYLGVQLAAGTRERAVAPNLIRFDHGLHTHGYFVRGASVPKLMRIAKACAFAKGWCAHIDEVFSQTSSIIKLRTTPLLAIQEDGYSDIAGCDLRRLEIYAGWEDFSPIGDEKQRKTPRRRGTHASAAESLTKTARGEHSLPVQSATVSSRTACRDKRVSNSTVRSKAIPDPTR